MFPSSILDKKIWFVEKVTTTDSFGVPTETEKDKFFVWANMYVRTGSMYNSNHSSYPTNNVEWKMRYRSDIDYGMMIKYNDQYYKIDFIEELGTKDGLRIESSVAKFNEKV